MSGAQLFVAHFSRLKKEDSWAPGTNSLGPDFPRTKSDESGETGELGELGDSDEAGAPGESGESYETVESCASVGILTC